MAKEFEFAPKQWVLTRDEYDEKWGLDIFSYSEYNTDEECEWFYCVGGWSYQCIPYEGNERLLGTTDDYVEPYEPKDGDFVVCEKKEEGPQSICIFKGWNGDRVSMYCIFFYSELKPIIGLDEREFNSDKGFLRKATDSETSDFLSKLHEIGKDWDAEKKEIVDWRWKPERTEEYHYCAFNDELNEFKVETTKNWELEADKNRIKSGNCYKEWVDCSNRCDRMNKVLKGE